MSTPRSPLSPLSRCQRGRDADRFSADRTRFRSVSGRRSGRRFYEEDALPFYLEAATALGFGFPSTRSIDSRPRKREGGLKLNIDWIEDDGTETDSHHGAIGGEECHRALVILTHSSNLCITPLRWSPTGGNRCTYVVLNALRFPFESLFPQTPGKRTSICWLTRP